MADETEKVIAEFVERMGLILQADGKPRIAGRILGLMVVHGGPFGFTELAERLSVSRASISTNTRLLEDLGIIERTSMPGDRQDYFRLSPQPYARLLRGIFERMHRARDVVGATRAALPKDMAGAQERLAELDAFYETLINNFETVIEVWDAKGKSPGSQKRELTEQPA
ncbi:GbsR/MarR family transcriptional regulator [Methyloceanibacter superfactus]|uniref:GbsR/MarR family transcriptional regulator n=1 Tax=Methyloceanibacter superfactus TaxID=1774969 RepID=UPI0008499B7E|nr:MarR family transcriptional regulator [Methyloceanibacter superfactus]